LNQVELYAQVALQLKRWLGRAPEVGHSLTLTDLSYPLLVKIVSRQGQEWILKLIDGERASGSAVLREQLDLTERESEVIYWIANGKTNREAAEILTMSPRTVNKHLEQIYAKLQVDNRTSAAGIALKVLAQSESFA
jgi:DNA-binding CsgD family transcriptional regulator